MATVAFDAEGPGKGAFSPVRGNMSRGMKIVTGKFSFDSSYPTNGEDISEIFNMFAECHGISVDHPMGAAAFMVQVDYTAKKLKCLTNALAEVANTTNLAAFTNLRWIAWGM